MLKALKLIAAAASLTVMSGVFLVGRVEAYTGYNISWSPIENYGSLSDPSNDTQLCDESENCRTFPVYTCGTIEDVRICFGDYDWECMVPALTPTNDPSPDYSCSPPTHGVDMRCRATGTGPAWTVCAPIPDCLSIPGYDGDHIKTEIEDDPRNQWVEDMLDAWENGDWVYTTQNNINCIC